MESYKIIYDETLNFKGNQQLYVMIVKSNKQHYLEINSRTFRVGRRRIADRKTSDIVIRQVIQSLSRYTDLQSALDVLNLAFSRKSLKEFMFLVKVINHEYNFDEIYAIKRHFDCFMHNVSILDECFDAEEITNSIAITFRNQKFPIGYFQTKTKDEYSKYIFVISEYTFHD